MNIRELAHDHAARQPIKRGVEAYYIRPNHKQQTPRQYCFITMSYRSIMIEGQPLKVMHFACCWRMTLDKNGNPSREKITRFTDAEALRDYLLRQARPKAPLMVIGSEIVYTIWGGRLAELLAGEGWERQFVYDRGAKSVLVVTKDTSTIKFLSLENWLPNDLDHWAQLVNLQRPAPDEDAFLDLAEFVNLERDLEIIVKAFLMYLAFIKRHDMGQFALTLSGQAFRCYRHKFLTEKLLHYDQGDVNALTRQAYMGGRVEARLLGSLEGVECSKLDVNSMYPFAMHKRRFPTRIRQWLKRPRRERIVERLHDHCIIAKVRLSTDEPVYPVRDGKRLTFPIGEIETTLCSSALQYALDHDHIVDIDEAMIFYSAELFTEFVDYFYDLKRQYKREGNPFYYQLCKLILNGFYGKWGETYSEELYRAEVDDLALARMPAVIYETGEIVTETWAFGVYTMEGGKMEGPSSMPAIAAHITDNARMILWHYLQQVGLKYVYYCDTDGFIVPTEREHSLEGSIDDEQMGALNRHGRTDRLEIRGPKDYTFGETTKRSGIRPDALEHSPGRYTQDYTPGLYSLIRAGSFRGIPITHREITLKSPVYRDKRARVSDAIDRD